MITSPAQLFCHFSETADMKDYISISFDVNDRKIWLFYSYQHIFNITSSFGIQMITLFTVLDHRRFDWHCLTLPHINHLLSCTHYVAKSIRTPFVTGCVLFLGVSVMSLADTPCSN